MALSGTITGTTSNKYVSAKLVWSATQSTSGNYSTVTATLSYSRTNSGYTTYGTWDGSITIGSTTIIGDSKYITITQNSNTVAMTATVKVPHNTDGSKSIVIAATGGISGTSFSSTSIGKSVTLDTIPRASTVKATAANIGSNTTITISRASSSFTHTLTYSFGGLTGTIATKTDNTSVSWTVPTTFYAKIPSAKSGTCTITCTTYSGSTSVGTSTCTFIATAAESNCKPTISPTIKDTGSVSTTLTGDGSNKIISGYNTMSIATGAGGVNSATIVSQYVSCGGKTISSASGTMNHVTSGNFIITVTDSRGYSSSTTVKKTLINYVKPTCALSVTPPFDGTMTLAISGNCFTGSLGAVTNTLTVQYRYKTNGGSYGAWTNVTGIATSGNTYSSNNSVASLDYKSAYTVQARVLDKIYNDDTEAAVYSDEVTVKALPVFDWGESDFNFNVPVTIEGRQYGENKVLWSGAYYMNGSQTITLKEAVSAQPHGIILVFSLYSDGSALNMNITEHFVSKYVVTAHNGSSVNHDFHMGNATHGVTGAKTLYISDTQISGNDVNAKTYTGADGVTTTNSAFVLRYVIGV